MKKNYVILKARQLELLKEHFTESYYKRFFRSFDVYCVASNRWPGYYYKVSLNHETKSRNRVMCIIRMITIVAGNVRSDGDTFFRLLDVQSKLVQLLVRV